MCSCLPGYIGSSPNCRPECVVSSECSQNRACINMKCADPCISACGQNARCQVVNHNPICSCSPGYTGDPFIRCVSQRKCMCNECTQSFYMPDCVPSVIWAVHGNEHHSSECVHRKKFNSEKCQIPNLDLETLRRTT